MSKLKLKEPGFMKEIHKIRAKLAQISYSQYKETLKKRRRSIKKD